jgi:hypothetical protein
MNSEYDRSKMQHKDNILRFEWGDFPAIGIKHFEERRDERTKQNSTDIFDKSNLSDEQVILECFKILRKEKYKFIIDTNTKNKPKNTEWVVGFETDEPADKGSGFKFIFLVFSISIKETAMNGIKQGEEFLSCITVVKDTFKNKRELTPKIVEQTLCYARPDGGDFEWTTKIPRDKPRGS